MKPGGLQAFENRREDRSRRYSYEQQGAKLGGEYEAKLKANAKAWEFFKAQPPGYQKVIGWWVMSAKKEETRLRRLERLIAESASNRKIDSMKSNKE
jgi:uncharacterized protein YdeI (YjbR/CyaY-like superfamily)